jgi:predicted O-methyltransferase YrrM
MVESPSEIGHRHQPFSGLPGYVKILSPLPPAFHCALLSMYNGEPQLGSDGERHSLTKIARISPEEGMWLYSLCRESKPKATLEIGLAYGFSTVYFLAAIHENGLGYHTAIDPFQRGYQGIGSRQSQTLGMGDRFLLIEDKSFPALIHLAERGKMFEVIFVDGNHHFDNALVDFTLSAELCPMGGCIILDDMWMPSIRMAVAFIRSNRKDFEEIHTPVRNIAAFRRIGKDARDWRHYVGFFDLDIRRFSPAFLRELMAKLKMRFRLRVKK